MRYLLVMTVVVLLFCIGATGAEEATPPPGLAVVYAVTVTTQKQMLSAIYAYEPSSGLQRLLYRDPQEGSRALLRIAGSDLLGAGRTSPPNEIYLAMGATTAPSATAPGDAISRLYVTEGPGQQGAPERVLSLPICFSEGAPYLLWNRAPVFAVGPGAGKFAVYALRVAETKLPQPSIRILAASGAEEWQIALDDHGLYVADLAFSPDGKHLAYSVMPHGDEHTLDQALLPKAGLYLADLAAHTVRLVYPAFADALVWGPKPDQITIAVRAGDIWSTKYLGLVISLPAGRKVREFSLRGAAAALAYSDDAQWLAVQTSDQGKQQIWAYPVAGGWGRQAKLDGESGGRISLLGWVRLAP